MIAVGSDRREGLPSPLYRRFEPFLLRSFLYRLYYHSPQFLINASSRYHCFSQ